MLKSARHYAHFGGALYLAIFAAALFGEVFVSGALIVDGDPVATAGKIAASEQLWRFGVGAQALTLICDVGIAWILYVLLKSVDTNISLLAAFFRLTYVAVYAPAVLANIAALRFAQSQAAEGVISALRVHDMSFTLSLIFFGVHLLLVGYLMGRSPISVAWLAVALEIAGACYLINSFAVVVMPSLHATLFPWILLPPFVGELGLAFWLLFTRRIPESPLGGSAELGYEQPLDARV